MYDKKCTPFRDVVQRYEVVFCMDEASCCFPFLLSGFVRRSMKGLFVICHLVGPVGC